LHQLQSQQQYEENDPLEDKPIDNETNDIDVNATNRDVSRQLSIPQHQQRDSKTGVKDINDTKRHCITNVPVSVQQSETKELDPGDEKDARDEDNDARQITPFSVNVTPAVIAAEHHTAHTFSSRDHHFVYQLMKVSVEAQNRTFSLLNEHVKLKKQKLEFERERLREKQQKIKRREELDAFNRLWRISFGILLITWLLTLCRKISWWSLLHRISPLNTSALLQFLESHWFIKWFFTPLFDFISPSFGVVVIVLFVFAVRFLAKQLSFEVVLPGVVAFLILTYWTKFIHIIVAFIVNSILAFIIIKFKGVTERQGYELAFIIIETLFFVWCGLSGLICTAISVVFL